MKSLRELGESVKRRRVFFLVLALAVCVRVYRLDLPFLEPFNSLSRQAICATVARNYYAHGFNLFYPEIDEGAGPYLYNAELPLNTYLMALAYQAAGGVREWAARSVSVLFSLAWLAALYALVKRLSDPRTALAALTVAAFSPLSVALSRSIQPDVAMAGLGAAAVWLYARHLDKPSRAKAFGAAALFACAALVKIHALHLALPMAWLAVRQRGWRYFRSVEPYLLALSVLPALVWYAWMAHLGRTLPLVYQPYHYFPDDAAPGTTYWSFFTPETLALNAKFFAVHLMTPLGAIAVIAGLLKKGKTSADSFFAVWASAAVVYLLASWPTAVRQSYYQLALLPPCAYLAGRGLVWSWDHGRQAGRVFVAAGALLTLPFLAHYYSKLYFLTAEGRAVVEAGRAVDAQVPGDARIVASYGSSPILLYYANRKGWTLDLSENRLEQAVSLFNRALDRGASYFVTARAEDLEKNKIFRRLLATHAVSLDPDARGEGWVLFHLKTSADDSPLDAGQGQDGK